MAESKIVINRPNTPGSPPPSCAICLGNFSNKCFSDSCMHEFCFKCLLEWSKIKAECPLCKKTFKRIIHNVKSNDEYDEHVVVPNEIGFENDEYLFLPLGVPPQPTTRRHFHFRTTFTVDAHGEHAIQQMLLTHPLTTGGHINTGGYPLQRNMYHRRRRENTTTSFRRSIYTRNLWVYTPPDVSGNYRDCSPRFYRNNPAARTRLVPWLNRELNALLYENTQLVMHVVDSILNHLVRHHICSRTFRNMLQEYLDNKTEHFIHEFYSFMRSPFDMISYDRHIIYTERPTTPLIFVPDEEMSDDSDVIYVGSTSNPQQSIVIDILDDTDDDDSDEPILITQDAPMPAPVIRPLSAATTTTSSASTSRNQQSTTTTAPAVTAVLDCSTDDDDNDNEDEKDRKPLLPLKLRLKRRRQSREERHKSSASSGVINNNNSGGGGGKSRLLLGKKKKIQGGAGERCSNRSRRIRRKSEGSSSSGSSSRSTSSTSTSSTDSSTSSSSCSEDIHKRYKKKRKQQQQKASSSRSNNKRKSRSKISHLKRHESSLNINQHHNNSNHNNNKQHVDVIACIYSTTSSSNTSGGSNNNSSSTSSCSDSCSDTDNVPLSTLANNNSNYINNHINNYNKNKRKRKQQITSSTSAAVNTCKSKSLLKTIHSPPSPPLSISTYQPRSNSYTPPFVADSSPLPSLIHPSNHQQNRENWNITAATTTDHVLSTATIKTMTTATPPLPAPAIYYTSEEISMQQNQPYSSTSLSKTPSTSLPPSCSSSCPSLPFSSYYTRNGYADTAVSSAIVNAPASLSYATTVMQQQDATTLEVKNNNNYVDRSNGGGDDSSNDDCTLNILLDKMRKALDGRKTEWDGIFDGPSTSSGSINNNIHESPPRLKNIMLRKEEDSNKWYTTTHHGNNNDSESSDY